MRNNRSLARKHDKRLPVVGRSYVLANICGGKNLAAICHQIPGLAIFYSGLVHGMLPIFKRYVEIIPAIHNVLIFLSVKTLPVSRVPPEERFIFQRVPPSEIKIFRCVVRYGYAMCGMSIYGDFEQMLAERLKDDMNDESKSSSEEKRAIERETEEVDQAWSTGIVHLVGANEEIAA